MALLGGRSTIEVTDLPPEIQAAAPTVHPAVDFPDAGVDLPDDGRTDRARSDRSGAVAHRRQQGGGGGLAESEADDARRES